MEIGDEKSFFCHAKHCKVVHTWFSSRVDFKGKVSAEKHFVRNCFSEVSSTRMGDKKSQRKDAKR